MRFSNPLVSLSVLILTGILSACGGGGGGGGGSGTATATGTLSVGLTDSSTSKYLAVYITIDDVQVNRNHAGTPGNSGWSTVATPKETYNLLKLINGLTAVLGGDEFTVGTYHQVRLILGKKAQSENNILGVPHPYANYVILNDGLDTTEQLKIPSGFQTGIKLVHNFQVLENETVELILDFDACRSVVERGNGKFLLKPTIKIIETEDKNAVFGDVTDTASDTPIDGALVSAQISDGLSARVERSTLTSDEVGHEGQYQLLLSPGQDYSIVAFSDKKVGAPGAEEMYAPECAGITVPASGDTRLDFDLTKTDFGTISGSVFVDSTIDPDNPPVVYINIYTTLPCGYVEAISLPMSPEPASNPFSFSVDLPLGTYDVVAASQGFDPDTATDVIPGDTVHLSLSPQSE